MCKRKRGEGACVFKPIAIVLKADVPLIIENGPIVK